MNGIFDLMSKMKEATKTEVKTSKRGKKPSKIKVDYKKLQENDINFMDSITDYFAGFSISKSKEVLENTAKLTIELVLDFVGKASGNTASSNKSKFENNLNAIKEIVALNGSKPNKKQQDIISKFVGWGGLSKELQENEGILKNLMGESAFNTAKSSVNTAFYTGQYTVKFIWNVLKRMGFEKGKILEPSMGTGNFFKYLNAERYYDSKITGIEMDNFTSKIAAGLFQSTKVLNGKFEDIKLKDDSFDLIISNIPFNNISVYDSETKTSSFIHEMFFRKAIRKVRDKGLIAFVTSTGIMDKKDNGFRKEIDASCTFLGAVRLPKGIFDETNTSADIIFLQKGILEIEEEEEESIKAPKSKNKAKKDEIEQEKKEMERKKYSWVDSIKYLEDKNLYINEYFINNPHMVMGEIKIGSNQYGETLVFENSKILGSSDFKKMEKYFNYDIYVAPINDSYMFEENELMTVEDDSVKNGEFTILNGRLYQRQDSFFIPLNYTGERLVKIKDYIELKEISQTIIKEQLDGCSDERLKEVQKSLNTSYEKFIKKYGFINSRVNKRLLGKCIMYTFVSSLEDYVLETKEYIKSDIFSKRTIAKEIEVAPENLEESIAVSLSKFGMINVKFISNSLNRTFESITDELLENELCYLSHDGNYLIYKDEYLSGNVRAKLEEAEQLGSMYEKNIEALKTVMPEPVTDIIFSLNSTWVPLDIKKSFIVECLDLDEEMFNFVYSPTGGYILDYPVYRINQGLNEKVWGTSRVTGMSILNKILNLGDFTVYDYDSSLEKNVKNPEETQMALNFAGKWKSEFVAYVNKDQELLKELGTIYNNKFNNLVERKFHNIFKNINHNPNITLKKHQLDAITRAVTNNKNTLLLHEVGAGKTFTFVTISELNHKLGVCVNGDNFSKLSQNSLKRYKAMNSLVGKRVVGKTLLVAPNQLCNSGTIAREYLRLFPQAKLLATSPEDFKRDNRRRLINKIAFGDWSCVIVPMSVLGLMALSPDVEKSLIEEDLKEVDDTIDFLAAQNIKSYSLKDLEKMRDNFKARLKKLNDQRKDKNTLYFNELGFTNIIIDEMHNFKGLSLSKKLSVSGSTSSVSKRATDLYNKIRWHESIFGEGTIVGATATPISNSLVELYVMLKYLYRSSLSEYSIETFDAFASNFAEIVSQIEIDPTGQSMRLKSRLAKYNNVPELIRIFRQIADVVNISDIKDVKIPKRVGGKPQIEIVEPSEAVKDYIDNLVERANKITTGCVSKTEDNMLSVTLDGRKVALSPRLAGINEESPKLKRVAERVSEIWKEHPDKTQIIFCSLGVPKGIGEYSTYDEIKDNLIKLGMDKSDIRYMQNANTTEKRVQLVEDFNNGVFKVLIGSDSCMSEGLNIQTRLIGVHHTDVPWKSSQIIQRNGRCYRNGNCCDEAYEIRYCTKQSFDAYSWQIVEMKAKYIAQILSGMSTDRVSMDLEDSTLSYEACKACASSNPKILELAQKRRELSDLKLLEKAYKTQIILGEQQKENSARSLKFTNELIKSLNDDIDTFNNNEDIIINGKVITDEETGIKEVAKIMKLFNDSEIATIRGLKVVYKNQLGAKALFVGNSEYRLEWKAMPKTLYRHITNVTTKMLDKLDVLEENKLKFEKTLKDLSSVEVPVFEKQDNILNLEKEIKAIEVELTK